MTEPSQQKSDQKKSVRARLRQRLMQMDQESLHHRSVIAARRLAATPEFDGATALMIFLPLRYEVDARPLALRAWQSDKTVTVPLVSYEQKHMLPMLIRSLDEPMRADRHGVRVPKNAEPFPVELIDVVVVPGLGFDPQGHRIGRGAGFYDRFLAQPDFRGITCGFALDEQLIDAVPTHSHDVPVDMIVTDRQTLRFQHARRSAT